MNLALPTASLTTVVAASAAELKDPALVAQEWEKVGSQIPAIRNPGAGLRSQVDTPPIFPERTFHGPSLWETPLSVPRARFSPPFDKKSRRPEQAPEPQKPEGAKPYKYNDDTYWLVPLTV